MNRQESTWRYFLCRRTLLRPAAPDRGADLSHSDRSEPIAKIMLESQGWSNLKKTIVPPAACSTTVGATCWRATGPYMKWASSCSHVENPQTIAQTVATMLDVDYHRRLYQASLKPSDTAVYAVLADNVSQEQIDKLRS